MKLNAWIRLGGVIMAARLLAAQARRGDEPKCAEFFELLRNARSLLEMCASDDRFVDVHGITERAIACADACARNHAWPAVWAVLDMTHNVGMLGESPTDWDNSIFMESFVEPHLTSIPANFAADIRSLASRLLR